MNGHESTYIETPATREYMRRPNTETPTFHAGQRPDNLPTVNICGIDFSNISREECLDYIDSRVREKRPGYAILPTVDQLCRNHTDDALERACRDSALLLGGAPILWASKLLHTPLREKFNGANLTASLCEHAANQGHSVYFLGADEGVADKTSRALMKTYPGLKIAGTYSPPKSFEHDRELSEDVLQRVRDANPDICFVALGSPKQEMWMQTNYKASGVPFMLGIGDSLEFLARHTKRTPHILHDGGLEWVCRLGKQPRQLAKRYLIDSALFIALLWKNLRQKRHERSL